MTATAAHTIVQSLLLQGVERVFCVPGESYLAVLDALRDSPIDTIVCRHEGAAAHMAEAHGKLTGRPGVCFVTRGPGATHASIGVHTARQDSTPLILFIGQAARADLGKEAFQEVDFVAMFAPLAKGAVRLSQAERTGEVVQRAFALAMQGRRGPVVIELPEDLLHEPGPAALAPAVPPGADLSSHAVSEITQALAAARAPIAILGGGDWSAAGVAAYQRFAAAWDLPTALSFRRKDLLDNTDPRYVGDLGFGANPDLVAAVREADVILAIGARLGEVTSQGYSLFGEAGTADRLFHIYPDPDECNRVWPARRAYVASSDHAAAALAAGEATPNDWAAWRAAARAAYGAFATPGEAAGAVNLAEIVRQVEAAAGENAIICNGAGNYAAWVHRYHRHRRFKSQMAPTSGAMGYGLPAGIAAKLAAPDRTVVVYAGDGCFLMSAQELATAKALGLKIIVIVCDNESYGTIRMHQERAYPGRPHATSLKNPDFDSFAKAFGCPAFLVERTETFTHAFEKALAADEPTVIWLRLSLEDIAPGRRLTGS